METNHAVEENIVNKDNQTVEEAQKSQEKEIERHDNKAMDNEEEKKHDAVQKDAVVTNHESKDKDEQPVLEQDEETQENHKEPEEHGSNEDIQSEIIVEYKEKKKKKKTSARTKRKIKQRVVFVLSCFAWVLSFLLILMGASNLYQQVVNKDKYTGFFGIGEAIVSSGSMEPMLSVNDLIFYKEETPENIKPGDVVVYKKADNDNTVLIVHEVQEIADGYVTTKGMANALPDVAFPYEDIVGVYLFKIPMIGAVMNLLTTDYAPLIVIAFILILFISTIVYYQVKRKKLLKNISNNKENRNAISYFFDL